MNQTITKEMLACLELALMEGVSSAQAAKWSRCCGGSAAMLGEFDIWKEKLPGMKADVKKNIEEVSMLWRQGRMTNKAARVIQDCKEKNISWITWEDDKYPERLKEIIDPPVALFYRGDLDLANQVCVSVVGSRKAGAYGQKVAYEVAAEAAKAGITVVSGLAMGIDAAAHEGCLQGGSPTVAVLGCGIDVDYPLENLELKERIIKQGGLLLSEYPPGARASRQVFQVRNRIMSGLGKALIMMESQIQSGSMLTVHHALDQGKEVFAYPGIPGTEWAKGAHQLLREGANYFTSAQDILEDLGWEDDRQQPTSEQRQALPPLSEDQRKVFSLLSRGEMSFDQLVYETGLTTPALSIALTMLQMSGLVKALPGKM